MTVAIGRRPSSRDILAAVFIAVELADLGTYLQAPAFEGNPLMAVWTPTTVLAKAIGLTTVALIAYVALMDWTYALTLGICIVIAAFSLGTNVAVLSLR